MRYSQREDTKKDIMNVIMKERQTQLIWKEKIATQMHQVEDNCAKSKRERERERSCSETITLIKIDIRRALIFISKSEDL